MSDQLNLINICLNLTPANVDTALNTPVFVGLMNLRNLGRNIWMGGRLGIRRVVTVIHHFNTIFQELASLAGLFDLF